MTIAQYDNKHCTEVRGSKLEAGTTLRSTNWAISLPESQSGGSFLFFAPHEVTVY